MADPNEYDIPQEVPASADRERDPENVIRGHKAAISNPSTDSDASHGCRRLANLQAQDVSDKAKEHSRQVLESYDEPYKESSTSQSTSKQTGHKDPGNVARGLKASISNPGVSEEAKDRARKKLEKNTMSKTGYAYTDDKEGADIPREAPEGIVDDPSYKTSKNESVPVIDDNEEVEDPIKPGSADSDKQLQQDEKEAIDPSNIIKERTRHATKPGGTYAEPSDADMGLME
ncbi:hypothetical protein B0T21DRAFT_379355 [Apiosordaria backusii]|uniref:Uncharacterized protein n=1 Tax=Apiosordaria backusii TaxID=314023 RepID=A0AA40K602_9PEZI|nr:hypothetical protein B0T21DRAFT_379355 [Apiosordaria backusii]